MSDYQNILLIDSNVGDKSKKSSNLLQNIIEPLENRGYLLNKKYSFMFITPEEILEADLIITCNKMTNEISGIDFSQRIRDSENTVPIILMSRTITEVLKQEAKKLGIKQVVSKNKITGEQITKLVGDLLAEKDKSGRKV